MSSDCCSAASQGPHIGLVGLPGWGGTGVVAADLAYGLARDHMQVSLFALESPTRFRAPDPHLTLCGVDLGDHPAANGLGLYPLALAGKILQRSRDQPIDVLHLHYAVPHVAAAVLVKQALGQDSPKVILTFHGTDATDLAADPRYQPLLRSGVLAMDFCTGPSRALCEIAQNHLQLPKEAALTVVANGIDTDRFCPPPQRNRQVLRSLFPHADDNSPILLHVSNLRPVKRPQDLAAIAAAVQARIPCRLLVVGDGPGRANLEQSLENSPLQGRVAFLGNRADCVDLLQHADLLLLPSASEGFGLAALEALACGLPVVASRTCGLPEVVQDGVTGRLHPVGDVAMAAAYIVDLLVNSAEHARMSALARRDAVQRFDHQQVVARWQGIYRSLMAN